MRAKGYRCACTPMHEQSRVHRHVRQYMEEHSLTCTCTQTWFAHATNIHVCTQVDVHSHTHSHAFANYHGDAPQQVGTSSCSAHSPTYTQACAPVHTQGVFQEELFGGWWLLTCQSSRGTGSRGFCLVWAASPCVRKKFRKDLQETGGTGREICQVAFRDTKQTEHRAQLLQSPREVKVPSLALPHFPTSVRQNLLESGLAT